jgi:hypothetical protein
MWKPIAALMVFSSGCGGLAGGGGDAWAGGQSQLAGLVAFDNGLAPVTLTLAQAYAGPTSTGGMSGSASALITDSGTTVMEAGTFDPSSRQLTLTGAGGSSISATADSSGMSGVAEHALGPGAFAVAPDSPTVLCGSFAGSLSGSFGLLYNGAGRAIAVYAIANAQSRGTLEGTISGGSLEFSSFITYNGHNLMIQGSAGGGSAHGTWSDTASTNGTWSASHCP